MKGGWRLPEGNAKAPRTLENRPSDLAVKFTGSRLDRVTLSSMAFLIADGAFWEAAGSPLGATWSPLGATRTAFSRQVQSPLPAARS
jgi:hypothetical protein